MLFPGELAGICGNADVQQDVVDLLEVTMGKISKS